MTTGNMTTGNMTTGDMTTGQPGRRPDQARTTGATRHSEGAR